MWVLDHLADIASDFSVLHRVDDIGETRSSVFFAFAHRLPAYQGVMRLRAKAREAQEPAAPPVTAAAQGSAPRPVVGGTRAELQTAPEFAGVFSFSKAGG